MSKHAAEHLEVLGKNASARYRAGQASTLTEAVIDVVKTAGLLPEQVKRVVEYANTDAFLTEFKKEGSNKVVELAGGPASPFAVMQSLNQPVRAHEYDRGTSDYDHPPTEKHASAEGMDRSLREGFRVEAPAEYPYENPFGEAYALQQKLASTEATLTGQLTMLEGAFHDMLDRLYSNVKQAALEGVPLGDVVQAWASSAGAETPHVKLAFSFMAPKLIEDRVFRGGDAVGASLEKFATGRLVNPAHPLVTDFEEFCEVVSKLASTRAARAEISSGLGQINYFLKHASAAPDPGLIKRVYDASGHLGENYAKPAAEWVTKKLMGPASPAVQTVGELAHGAVKHVPTAAALVGANEVRRNLKHSPAFQGVKDTALSVVPGTPQYQQREYELQAGGGGFQMPMGY